MDALATRDDLVARWPSLEAVPAERLAHLLADATAWVRIWYPGVPSTPVEPLSSAARSIVAAMVKRALAAENREGLTQSAEAADGFSRSHGYSNPDGNLFLTAQERATLEAALALVGAGPSGAVSRSAAGL